MSDNEENDNENNNQQSEPSKLPKPGSVDHYFNKIDSNPKFIQLDAKLKPDPNNKNTKFTYKTNAGSFSRKNLTSNSRLKFQAKEGKTKISVSMKMFGTSWEKSSKSEKEETFQKREIKQDIKEIPQKEKTQIKEHQPKLEKVNSCLTASKLSNTNSSSNSSSKTNSSNNGDLDISLSTSYNNSRLNLRVKDHGQLDAKFTQTFELIPNILKSKAEYLYEYKNMQHIHKGTFDFTLSTRLQKWINKVQIQNQLPDKQFQYFFSKNQTKFKARFNSHDSQLKLNTIAHFGQLENVDPIAILPQNVTGKQEKVFLSYLEKNQQESAQRLAYLSSVDENLTTKIQIENKLTVPHRSVGDFNLKSVLKYEQVEVKKLYKIQTIVNHHGIHNIEGRHVWKFIPMHVIGCMAGINWNSHSSQWHKKWEIVFEKQGLFKLRKYGLDFSCMGISLNDKTVGLKLQKKFNGNSKAEVTISRKWSSGGWWPNYGFKLNFNW